MPIASDTVKRPNKSWPNTVASFMNPSTPLPWNCYSKKNIQKENTFGKLQLGKWHVEPSRHELFNDGNLYNICVFRCMLLWSAWITLFPMNLELFGASALQLGCAMEGCPNPPWLSKAIFNRPNGQKGWRGSGIYLDFWYANTNQIQPMLQRRKHWWEKIGETSGVSLLPKKTCQVFFSAHQRWLRHFTPFFWSPEITTPAVGSKIFTLTPAAKSTLPFGWSKPALFPCSLYSINVSVLSTMKEKLKKI